ncbi:MAG: DEAD/DEAH box helicase [bacterium]
MRPDRPDRPGPRRDDRRPEQRDERRDDRRPEQRDERRDERRSDGHDERRGDARPPRRDDRRGGPPGRGPKDAGRMEQGHTPSSESRPGGLVTDEETARRRELHLAWQPESFQVPPEEGKARFHDFDLPAEVMHAIADLGFQYCTPIQSRSLAHALAGQNVAGRAQTGTGKTAAFLIALLTRYLRHPAGRPAKVATPRALVIAPTRELVIQICRDADSVGKYCGLRYLAVYGGMDHERQRRELTAGPVDLLVATPGRLLDYVQSRVIDLSQVDTLVIDEADRMLDMGFIPDVRRIISRLPPATRRCTMLYSATLDDEVMRLAAQWMTEPVRVEVEVDRGAVNTITQQVFVVASREKFNVLYNLLQRHADRRVLVFCNRRDSTEYVAEKLRRHGIACEMLSGDVQQNRRLRALEDFRSGKVRVVVATDVAGRGIHVDDIGFVVNYDFPYEPEDYVHRIGRTGRAGHAGTAISFADENESFIIPEIEKFLGESLTCTHPEEEMLRPPPDHRTGRRPDDRAHAHAGPADADTHRPSVETPVPAPAAVVAPEPLPVARTRKEEPSEVAPHAGHAPEWPDSAPTVAEHRAAAKPESAPRAPTHLPRPIVTPMLPSTKRTPEQWTPGQGKS